MAKPTGMDCSGNQFYMIRHDVIVYIFDDLFLWLNYVEEWLVSSYIINHVTQVIVFPFVYF